MTRFQIPDQTRAASTHGTAQDPGGDAQPVPARALTGPDLLDAARDLRAANLAFDAAMRRLTDGLRGQGVQDPARVALALAGMTDTTMVALLDEQAPGWRNWTGDADDDREGGK